MGDLCRSLGIHHHSCGPNLILAGNGPKVAPRVADRKYFIAAVASAAT